MCGLIAVVQGFSCPWHVGSSLCSEVKVTQPCPTLRLYGLSATRLLSRQSVEFFRQEYWSGLPFPSPGDLPDPGVEPGSPALRADALPSEPPGSNMCPCIGRQILNHWTNREVSWLFCFVVFKIFYSTTADL